MPDPKIVMVPIGDLRPAKYNPRKLSKKAEASLEASVRDFGFVDPLVVNGNAKRKNVVVGGHQRLKIAGKLGHLKVPVVYVDLDEKRERELNLRLNKNMGEFDWDLLKGFETDLLKLVGFDDSDILKNIGLSAESAGMGETDPDDLPKKPKAKRGEVYRLGDHVLMCGDATDRADVEKLMGGVRAEMVFTDPPWNVGIVGGDYMQSPEARRRLGGKTIQNDALPQEQYAAFLQTAAGVMQSFVTGDVYLVMSSSESPRLDGIMRSLGFHWSTMLIWVKDVFVPGRSKYHRRYEPIWYGWHSAGKSSYRGPRNQDDVWEVPRPKVSKDHPTQKPVEICRRAIVNSSQERGIVLDLFGGSGSTLMACEDTGRACRMMELDPGYCDVIVARWEKATGRKAEKAK